MKRLLFMLTFYLVSCNSSVSNSIENTSPDVDSKETLRITDEKIHDSYLFYVGYFKYLLGETLFSYKNPEARLASTVIDFVDLPSEELQVEKLNDSIWKFVNPSKINVYDAKGSLRESFSVNLKTDERRELYRVLWSITKSIKPQFPDPNKVCLTENYYIGPKYIITIEEAKIVFQLNKSCECKVLCYPSTFGEEGTLLDYSFIWID
jgi:hypothetical protein